MISLVNLTKQKVMEVVRLCWNEFLWRVASSSSFCYFIATSYFPGVFGNFGSLWAYPSSHWGEAKYPFDLKDSQVCMCIKKYRPVSFTWMATKCLFKILYQRYRTRDPLSFFLNTTCWYVSTNFMFLWPTFLKCVHILLILWPTLLFFNAKMGMCRTKIMCIVQNVDSLFE